MSLSGPPPSDEERARSDFGLVGAGKQLQHPDPAHYALPERQGQLGYAIQSSEGWNGRPEAPDRHAEAPFSHPRLAPCRTRNPPLDLPALISLRILCLQHT